ncbi:MAG TPA: hypothetical protein ENJ35_07845 [Gammaproteobacteria bacterium]|nr:hypothetical protein [Gammaproteobacteria bacterium]
MILRNFLFLDTESLNDYLAALQGHIVSGDITQTEMEVSGKSGKAGFKVAEGALTIEQSTETRQVLALTDAARFQKLYDLLDKENHIQYLDAFDEEIWGQLRKGELLEVESDIRFPESFKLFHAANELSSLLGFLKTFGENLFDNPQDRVMLEGISEFAAMSKGKPIPIVFEAVSTPGFSFFAKLNPKYVKCDLDDLEGEATVFGKIQRIVKPDKEIEVYSILPALTTSFSGLSRDEIARKKRELRETGGIDVLKGPAIVILPLAIYR